LALKWELLQIKNVSAWMRNRYVNPGRISLQLGLHFLCHAQPFGIGQTTVDTGCDSTTPRNPVDHPADRILSQKCGPIKFNNNSAMNFKQL